MGSIQPAGPEDHTYLLDTNKVQCEFCQGTWFQISKDKTFENTSMPTDNSIYLLENSTPTLPYGNVCSIPILCQCGKTQGLLSFVFDVCAAMTTPAVTGTHIAGTGAIDLWKGYYLTPIGGTSKGVSYLIASNTAADPVVWTVAAGINDNTNTEIIMISNWKVF